MQHTTCDTSIRSENRARFFILPSQKKKYVWWCGYRSRTSTAPQSSPGLQYRHCRTPPATGRSPHLVSVGYISSPTLATGRCTCTGKSRPLRIQYTRRQFNRPGPLDERQFRGVRGERVRNILGGEAMNVRKKVTDGSVIFCTLATNTIAPGNIEQHKRYSGERVSCTCVHARTDYPRKRTKQGWSTKGRWRATASLNYAPPPLNYGKRWTHKYRLEVLSLTTCCLVPSPVRRPPTLTETILYKVARLYWRSKTFTMVSRLRQEESHISRVGCWYWFANPGHTGDHKLYPGLPVSR